MILTHILSYYFTFRSKGPGFKVAYFSPTPLLFLVVDFSALEDFFFMREVGVLKSHNFSDEMQSLPLA